MALRMGDTPTGGTRVAYGVLAAVLAGLGGALLGTVAWPLLTNAQTCAADTTGFCAPAVGLVVYTVACWLVLAWLCWVLRLGWLFWLVAVVGQLVCVQAAVELVSVWPLVAMLAVVPLAGWVTSPPTTLATGPATRTGAGRTGTGRTGGGRTGAGRVTAGRVPDDAAQALDDGVPRRRLLVVVGVCVVLVVQLAVWGWSWLS